MITGGDPTPDLNKMMDQAGLDGRLLTQKGPFMKGVVDARSALISQLIEYISNERRRAFNAGVESAAQKLID